MDKAADICLLLEGTYPYVRGGVSSWVHQIITKLPELTFSLVFLGGSRKDYEGQRYQLPDNVVHLETHYMAESLVSSRAARRRGDAEQFVRMRKMHEFLRDPDVEGSMSRDLLARVFGSISRQGGITREDFLYSDESWKYVREQHYLHCAEDSFVDYFWTVRIMHAPLFKLAEIAHNVPRASAFHTVSTGYAGLMGAVLAGTRSLPLILSEHGIYTKERTIDLAQAEWISDAIRGLGGSLTEGLGYIRKLWIRFFEGLGRLTYQMADPIVSLYEGNRQRQLNDGAPEERTVIIPNGVNVARFEQALADRASEVPKVVGFIGRLVPIKDVKTFIRAMGTVCTEIPDAEGWLIGSSEEEPEYTADCEALVESLGLSGKVKFLGFQNVAEILPKLGVVVLTSISEALPLVILEGFAAGVPAVTTDVGACRELIEGRLPEDRALGSAGSVVPIADPEASGRAVVALLGDEGEWKRAQGAAIARVNRFYTEPVMMNAYRDIYADALRKAGADEVAARVATS
ncbi:MAG: GT4 family glycosyltransferase PelF [Proteobacteria bacterium]|nr:GT4 family glycosyltransferase PelF [Pseudomonadota bacterium]